MIGTLLSILTKHKSLIGIGVVVLIGLGAYWIYKTNLNKIEDLETKINVLQSDLRLKELEVSSLERTANQLENIITRNRELSDNLEKFRTDLNTSIDKQLEVFEERDRLSRLSKAKPGLIENRVNKATIEIFETIEEETKAFSSEALQ